MSDPIASEITRVVAEGLEQQMDALGLPGELRHFLRHLNAAWRQLNTASAMAQEGGDMGRCASRVYSQLYGNPQSTRCR